MAEERNQSEQLADLRQRRDALPGVEILEAGGELETADLLLIQGLLVGNVKGYVFGVLVGEEKEITGFNSVEVKQLGDIWLSAARVPQGRELAVRTALETVCQSHNPPRLAEVLCGFDPNLELSIGIFNEDSVGEKEVLFPELIRAVGAMVSWPTELISTAEKTELLNKAFELKREVKPDESWFELAEAVLTREEFVGHETNIRQRLVNDVMGLYKASDKEEKDKDRAIAVLRFALEKELTQEALGEENYQELINLAGGFSFDLYKTQREKNVVGEDVGRKRQLLLRLPTGDLQMAKAVLKTVLAFESSYWESRYIWRSTMGIDIDPFYMAIERQKDGLGEEARRELLEADDILTMAKNSAAAYRLLKGDNFFETEMAKTDGVLIAEADARVLSQAYEAALIQTTPCKNYALGLLLLLLDNGEAFLKAGPQEDKLRWIRLVEAVANGKELACLPLVLEKLYLNKQRVFAQACIEAGHKTWA